MASAAIGLAQAQVTLTLQFAQFQQQLAQAQRLTQQASARMAASFNQVNVAGNRMNTNMRRWGGGIQALSRQFLVLRAAMAGVVAVMGVRAIASAADAWVNLTAKLNQVTTGTGRVVAIQEQLFQIAQRTGAELEGVGDLYFKLSNASAELGMSQQQVMQFTESMGKLLVTSGVKAVQASQAIHQLSQSFTYQVLAGDELKTLYEAFPALINMIAAAQGKKAKDLIAIAKEEGIAIRDLIEPVLAGRAKIEREFSRMPVTIERSLAQVRNAFTKSIGMSGTASGAFKDITDALRNLAITLSSPEFQTGMGLMLQFLAALATKGAQAAAALGAVAQQMEGTSERFQTVMSELNVPQETIDKFKDLGTVLSTLWTGDPEAAIAIFRRDLQASGVDIDALSGKAEKWQEIWNNLRTRELDPGFIAEMGAEGGVSMAKLGEVIQHDTYMMNHLLGQLGKAGEVPSELPPGIDPKALEEAEDAAKKYRDALVDINEAIGQMQRQRVAEEQGEEAVAALERLENAASDAGMSVEELAKQPAELQNRAQVHQDEAAALDLVIERNKALKQVEEDRIQRLSDQDAELARVNEQAKKDAEQPGLERKQQIEAGGQLPSDIDAANIAASTLASTLTDLENLSLESLAQSFQDIAAQIAQAVIQALIFRAIMTGVNAASPTPGATTGASPAAGLTPMISNAHGNVFYGGHLKRMARGGFITKRPMIMPMARGGAMIGEAGPEAVMPLKRMASGNLGVASEGGGGGGAQQVNNIYANNIEPGTVSTLYNLANRAAPGAVVNARSRGLVRERKKPPF